MTELQNRFEREKKFHDRKYGNPNTSPRHYAVSPTYHVFQQLKRRLGDIEGKTILEIGCGTGWITYELVKAGAYVTACDISDEAVEATRNLLVNHGLDGRAKVIPGAVETLSLSASSMDYVVGFAILHHLDLTTALPTIGRVLREQGRLVAAEPLSTNPLINLYRRVTPQFRTADERPIDLAAFEKEFHGQWVIGHHEYYLLALIPLGLAYVPGGKSLFRRMSPTFHSLDEKLLRRWPALGKWAWYSIIDMLKKPHTSSSDEAVTV